VRDADNYQQKLPGAVSSACQGQRAQALVLISAPVTLSLSRAKTFSAVQ